MKLTIDGAVCVITGRLKTMTKARARERIADAGGRLASSVSGLTDFVVVLTTGTNDHMKGMDLGIPILDEDQLIHLLDGGSMELPDVPDEGESSVNDLLGEVRGVMQGPLTPEMWASLVELLDACREDDLHVLSDYIDTALERWETGPGELPRARSVHPTPREVCTVPQHWMGELKNGTESPKYRIPRALDLSESLISSSVIKWLLDHPDTARIERLKFQSMNFKVSRALLERICADERLRELGLGVMGARQNKAFLEVGVRPMGLVSLDLRHCGIEYHGGTLDFLHAPYLDEVEELSLSHVRDATKVLEQAEAGALGSVRTLRYTPYYDVDVVRRAILKSPWVIAHIEHLILEDAPFDARYSRSSYKQLFDLAYAGHLERLDLSGLRPRDEDTDPAHVTRMLRKFMPGPKLPHEVGPPALGEWATDARLDRPAARKAHLAVE